MLVRSNIDAHTHTHRCSAQVYVWPDFEKEVQCRKRADGEAGGAMQKEIDVYQKYFQKDFKEKSLH